MGPRVEISVQTAPGGTGPAHLILSGPIVLASGISISTNNSTFAERLTSNGIVLVPDPHTPGHAQLKVDWYEVGTLGLTRFA